MRHDEKCPTYSVGCSNGCEARRSDFFGRLAGQKECSRPVHSGGEESEGHFSFRTARITARWAVDGGEEGPALAG